VSFDAITLCVASQRAFVVVVVVVVVVIIIIIIIVVLFRYRLSPETFRYTLVCGLEIYFRIFLTSLLDGGEWSVLRFGRYATEERDHNTH